jgi:predicted HNH restriction endonuclease
MLQIGRSPSGKTIEQVLRELEKCELVCSNCHRIRTHRRREVVNRCL